ncbi:hypothetical protein ONZ45_g8390 [Pleurotus djamor]|nr:hypothetical protein ONZ45_g8390 [Pleurotus djamor]
MSPRSNLLQELPPSPSSSHPTQDDVAEDTVKNSRGNVLVETVAAGTLGLPSIAGPIYHDDKSDIKILHPSVLPLTKLSRWASLRGSTRPESIIRCGKDARDFILLIGFLVDLDLKLGIADYEGKSRPKILRLVSTFYHSRKDEKEFCEVLQKVMKPEDWEDMLQTPSLEVESETMPTNFRKRRMGDQKGKARSRAA